MADPRLESLVLSEDERRIRPEESGEFVMLLRQVGDRPGWWICPEGAV
jgi:hypothetical protein